MPTTACRVLEGPPEWLEIRLLLEGIRRRYGYDFLGHDASFVAGRIRSLLKAERLDGVTALLGRVLRDDACLERTLRGLSLPPQPLFRPASLHLAFRERIVPILRTYPSLRLWQIGSPSGEGAVSLAVMLEEAGLLSRSFVYVSDPNGATPAPRSGFPEGLAAAVAAAYRRAGGAGSLDDHFGRAEGRRVPRPGLLRRLVRVSHSLATDASFNEFQVIVGRGVLSMCGGELRARTLDLLHASLARLGFLALGPRERLAGTPQETHYRTVSRREGIYRKVSE